MCGLSILDVGSAAEPSYHMNIRSVVVQYMRANPDRFIESIVGDSWARYLANMLQTGSWAEALVIQAVADAF